MLIKTKAEREEAFTKRLEYALRLKAKMLEHQTNRAVVKTCPMCKTGTINMVLAGPKKHFHARCTTPGCFMVME
jgi:hypothetical protein